MWVCFTTGRKPSLTFDLLAVIGLESSSRLLEATYMLVKAISYTRLVTPCLVLEVPERRWACIV